MHFRSKVRRGVLALVALMAGPAATDAALLTYNFTATDGTVTGAGSLSYDLAMPLISGNPTQGVYRPVPPNAPVVIAFTSSYGTLNASLDGIVIVIDGDPTLGDGVVITATPGNSPGVGQSAAITLQDATATALGSTALPTSYNLAAFGTVHTLAYYDPNLQSNRTFTITSLVAAGSVPEPASLALVATGGLLALAGASRARRRGSRISRRSGTAARPGTA